MAPVSDDVKMITPTKTKSQTKPSRTWAARTPARAQLLGPRTRFRAGQGYLPLNSGFLFSVNAVRPSFASSLAKAR